MNKHQKTLNKLASKQPRKNLEIGTDGTGTENVHELFQRNQPLKFLPAFARVLLKI